LLIFISPVADFFIVSLLFSLSDVEKLKKTTKITFLGVLLLFLCLINPVNAVGIFRNPGGTWYLDYNNTGTVDKSFHFGEPGDIPITGDWDGNGIDGIAIFRPSTGYWYFDNNFDGSVDKSFRYGGSSDRIIKGDWDGDGIDGIAIFRPSTGYWYFDYNLDGIVDTSFRYGCNTDRIIVGMWQGNRDGIAIFRPSTGYWYFDFNLDGRVDRSFRYGGSSDRIIKGDWDGDRIDGIAIFRPSTGYWYFDFNLDGIVDRSFRYGGSSDQIVKGDWHGSGAEGIAIFRPSTGYWYFDNNLDGAVDRSFRYGGSTDRIVAGNWTSVPSMSPVADFTVSSRSGNAPLTVTFTDQSTGLGTLTYGWDFGDSGTSVARNPAHTYEETGTYTVTLRATNSLGTDTETRTGYITVTEGQHGEARAGIAITFDDAFVDDWYALRGMLQQSNAHVTFFVSDYGDLEETEIEMLRTLQADGHEIGYHGFNHLDATDYLLNHTVNEYINNEIMNGLTEMQADGFLISDFSYPHGYGNENTRLTAALQQYFIHMRSTNRGPIYYNPGSNSPVIYAQGIDDTTYGQSLNDIYDAISVAKENNQVVVFYSHRPVSGNPLEYQISYSRLQNIIAYASQNNMRFYTVSELT
jgi:PKD repeat protein